MKIRLHSSISKMRMSARQVTLGETVDFITGKTVADTLDERARQKIARFVVEQKGYLKDEIEVGRQLSLDVNGKKGTFKIDFVIRLAGKAFMIIIFGPGSLVSRERSALAAARLVEEYAVPFTVVTNGDGAELLETSSSRLIGEGLWSIPSRGEALEKLRVLTFETFPEKRLAMERRILFAVEVLARCECDECSTS